MTFLQRLKSFLGKKRKFLNHTVSCAPCDKVSLPQSARPYFSKTFCTTDNRGFSVMQVDHDKKHNLQILQIQHAATGHTFRMTRQTFDLLFEVDDSQRN